MATVESSVSVSGTVLHREGSTPLLAFAAMVGDRVTQASVIDPAENVDALAALSDADDA